jgi:cobalamin biosynthesis protein CobT
VNNMDDYLASLEVESPDDSPVSLKAKVANWEVSPQHEASKDIEFDSPNSPDAAAFATEIIEADPSSSSDQAKDVPLKEIAPSTVEEKKDSDEAVITQVQSVWQLDESIELEIEGNLNDSLEKTFV